MKRARSTPGKRNSPSKRVAKQCSSHDTRALSHALRAARASVEHLDAATRGMTVAIEACEDDVQCMAAVSRRSSQKYSDSVANVKASIFKAVDRLHAMNARLLPTPAMLTPRPPSHSPPRHTGPRRRRQS